MAEEPAAIEESCVEVWPENWASLKLFLSLSSQWRIAAGMGGAMWIGLDYAGVEAAIRLGGYRRPRRLFKQIQVLEQGALGVLNGKTA